MPNSFHLLVLFCTSIIINGVNIRGNYRTAHWCSVTSVLAISSLITIMSRYSWPIGGSVNIRNNGIASIQKK